MDTSKLGKDILDIFKTNPEYLCNCLVSVEEDGSLKKDAPNHMIKRQMQEEYLDNEIIAAFSGDDKYSNDLSNKPSYFNIGLYAGFGEDLNQCKWVVADVDKVDGKELDLKTSNNIINYMESNYVEFAKDNPELPDLSFYPVVSSSGKLHVWVAFKDHTTLPQGAAFIRGVVKYYLEPLLAKGGFGTTIKGEHRPLPKKKGSDSVGSFIFSSIRLGTNGVFDKDLVDDFKSRMIDGEQFDAWIDYINSQEVSVDMGSTSNQEASMDDEPNQRGAKTYPKWFLEPMTEEDDSRRNYIFYDIVSKLNEIAIKHKRDYEWIERHARDLFDWHCHETPDIMKGYDWDECLAKQVEPIKSQVGKRGYLLNNREDKIYNIHYDPDEDIFFKNTFDKNGELDDIIKDFYYIADIDKPYLLRTRVNNNDVRELMGRKRIGVNFFNAFFKGKCFTIDAKGNPKVISAVNYLLENFPENLVNDITYLPKGSLIEEDDSDVPNINVFKTPRKRLENFNPNHPIIRDLKKLSKIISGNDPVEIGINKFVDAGDYSIMVLASKTKQPLELICTAIVYKGPRRLGKSLWTDVVIPNTVGKTNWNKVPISVLDKEFNSVFKYRQAVVLSEMSSVTPKMMSSWISFITEEEVAYRAMRNEHCDPIPNYTTFFASANETDITDKNFIDDDKILILESFIDPKNPEHMTLLERIKGYKFDAHAWDTWYSYLHTIDLSQFDASYRSGRSKSKQRAVRDSFSSLDQGIMDLMNQSIMPFNKKAIVPVQAARFIKESMRFGSSRGNSENVSNAYDSEFELDGHSPRDEIAKMLIGEELNDVKSIQRSIVKVAKFRQEELNYNPKDKTMKSNQRLNRGENSVDMVLINDFDNPPKSPDEWRQAIKTIIGVEPKLAPEGTPMN